MSLPPCPDVVVVGAASRDVDAGDPRGWRLGGGVSYVSIGLGRLGLRVGACIGVDREAAGAAELDLLREAGVDLHLVELRRGPVFDNREGVDGRVQYCLSTCQRIRPSALPDRWGAAAALVLAPVAGEVDDAWAAALPGARLVALGWQGALRDLRPGERTGTLPPRLSRLVARADLIALSRDDVAGTEPGDALATLLGDGGRQIVVTAGRHGGLVVWREGGRLRARRYPAMPARAEHDLTGAGDAFLAGWVAGELGLDPVRGWPARGTQSVDTTSPSRSSRPADGARALQGTQPARASASRPRSVRALQLGALVASLKVAGHGIDGLPDRAALWTRARELAGGAARAGDLTHASGDRTGDEVRLPSV